MSNSSIDSKSRLVGAIDNKTYQEAESYIRSLKVLLIYDPTKINNASMQAALLTAVNTGLRCFQGGVYIHATTDEKIKSLLGNTTNDFDKNITNLGGVYVNNFSLPDYSFVLYFGINIQNANNALEVVAGSWIGGVHTKDSQYLNDHDKSLPMGGILAGSLAIGKAFLYCSNNSRSSYIENTVVNLWDLSDVDLKVKPTIQYFPKKLWLLGLGHLGQAYVWALSMLPSAVLSEMEVLLQDIDHASISNWESSLLTNESDIGKKKTRIAAEYLERHNTSISIVDRKYDKTFQRQEHEPRILICGLDNVEARKAIDHSNYSLIIDCGLGGDIASYDHMKIQVFPNINKHSDEVWNNIPEGPKSKNLSKMYENAFGCGYTDKGISTSFVGAFASAFVIAEIIKSFNDGSKTQIISGSIRDLNDSLSFNSNGSYNLEMANSGFIKNKNLSQTVSSLIKEQI